VTRQTLRAIAAGAPAAAPHCGATRSVDAEGDPAKTRGRLQPAPDSRKITGARERQVMTVRAVCLDGVGTLFTVREPVGVTYARFAARHAIHADPARVEAAFRRALAEAGPLAFAGIPPEEIPARERGWWRTIVAAAFGRAGVEPVPESLFDALYGHYGGGDAWRAYDDALPVLAELRTRGHRLAVVSNFDSRLCRVAAALGLSRYVDALVFPSTAGAAKPAPAIFLAAIRALGVAAEDALHVGDDLGADVSGARAAGIAGVLLDRGRRAARPAGVTVIEGLDELPALLDRGRGG
jgi:putative hydrolase of the HAD superfamily